MKIQIMETENAQYSWEEAVLWLRAQPDQEALVRFCYYDDPLEASAERFSKSEEAEELRRWVMPHLPGEVLDLGAGRGISSYAFAKMGCRVTALEPDSSPIVGADAIEQLAAASRLPIKVVREIGERLPFPDNSFEIVYARAVLHHARNLGQLCREAARVLKPDGLFIATREHVLSTKKDLAEFLAGHALHKLYGGENAYLLPEYTGAITGAGLQLRDVLGPFDSVINYFPMTTAEFQAMVETWLRRKVPAFMARRLAALTFVQRFFGRRLSRRSNTPGRLYSFLATKP
jgi:ubiquinone/menaquinone biosynthesis C-methylase UbiE